MNTRSRSAPDVERLQASFFPGLPRYEFLETIGRGGMGLVLKVRDRELGEVIAMKILLGAAGSDHELLLSRFKGEVSLNRRIKHPNVCRLHDFGISGGFPYLTMEFVAGRDLGRLVEADGPLAAVRAVRILGQISRGVAAAHAVGVVHRDLKPANLMIRARDEVSILDFGLAYDTIQPSPRITQVGTTVGTPHYMSPEQIKGQAVDGRSDIYGIGAIAYEALVGRFLYEASTPLSVAMKHLEEPVPVGPLEERSVPRELIAIVLRCLRKEPAARFQTAAELASHLETLARLFEPAPDPPNPTQRAVRTAVHDRGRILASVAAPPKRVVLIVDDEPAIRKLISQVLQEAGFETAESASGEIALDYLQTNAVDLVLMDVLMPGVDGLDTVRILKSQARTAAIPIIFISQFPERNRVAFASQTGAIAFMPKPLDLHALVEEARRILDSAV